MSNTLLLHIGTPKTGTSSIQHFLFQNREILLQKGWDYPDLKSKLSYLHDFAHNPEKNGNVFYEGIKLYPRASEVSDSVLHILEEFVQNNNVLLSAEEFYEYDTEDLLTRIKERITNVKVIIYLRRQDLYVESRWNQIVKDDRCYRGSFEQYVKDSKEWDEGHYLKKLESISKIIGEENIVVRVYERSQLFSGNVIEDFFHEMELDECLETICDFDCNSALYGELVEVKRAINHIYDVNRYGTGNTWTDVLRRVGEKIPELSRHGKSYFTPDERRRYLEIYDLENREIARRFLNRENGYLFMDLNTDIPRSEYKISNTLWITIQELMKEALEKMIPQNED